MGLRKIFYRNGYLLFKLLQNDTSAAVQYKIICRENKFRISA